MIHVYDSKFACTDLKPQHYVLHNCVGISFALSTDKFITLNSPTALRTSDVPSNLLKGTTLSSKNELKLEGQEGQGAKAML